MQIGARVIRRIADPLVRPQRRKLLELYALGGVLLAFGLAYFGGGLTVASSSKPYVIVASIPGGIRAHGLVQILLGVAVLVGVFPAAMGHPILDGWLKWVLAAGVGPYCGWNSLAFLLAPLAGGDANLGPIWWAFGCFTAYSLVIYPPPTWSEVTSWQTSLHS